MQQYCDKFEDEFIYNVTDVIQLSEQEANWNKLTSSFPIGVTNRIKMKLTELATATNVQFAFPFVHKECWIFYEPAYETIRTMKGNECLTDLPATIEDAANAKIIAMCIGIR